MVNNEDSDPIVSKNRGGDMGHIASGAFKKIDIKMAFFLFFIFILLNMDVFLTRVLGKIPGAVDEYRVTTTTFGTILSGTFLVIAYIIADILRRTGVF